MQRSVRGSQKSAALRSQRGAIKGETVGERRAGVIGFDPLEEFPCENVPGHFKIALPLMSVRCPLWSLADIPDSDQHVRFVPSSDIVLAENGRSPSLAARASRVNAL
jgi:hypothetical protein